MKTIKITDYLEGGKGKLANKIAQNVNKLVDYIPFQIGRDGNKITLSFSRFFSLFAFKDTFEVSTSFSATMFLLKLISSKNNKIEIVGITKEEVNKTKIDIVVQYKGEKEWIVGKYLDDIAYSILQGVKEISKVEEEEEEDLSHKLNSLSFLSKLMLKVKLEYKTQIIVNKGRLTTLLLDLIKKYADYNFIFITGLSEKSSFRLIYLNGEIKGAYLNADGVTKYGDEINLDDLEGVFQINIYTPLSKEVIRLIENEGL